MLRNSVVRDYNAEAKQYLVEHELVKDEPASLRGKQPQAAASPAETEDVMLTEDVAAAAGGSELDVQPPLLSQPAVDAEQPAVVATQQAAEQEQAATPPPRQQEAVTARVPPPAVAPAESAAKREVAAVVEKLQAELVRLEAKLAVLQRRTGADFTPAELLLMQEYVEKAQMERDRAAMAAAGRSSSMPAATSQVSRTRVKKPRKTRVTA